MTLPKPAQEGPYKIEAEKEKRYPWCSCGLSAKQPFCDGSHKGTEFRCVPWIAEKSETVYLCGCKHTKTPPFCDGSHSDC